MTTKKIHILHCSDEEDYVFDQFGIEGVEERNYDEEVDIWRERDIRAKI